MIDMDRSITSELVKKFFSFITALGVTVCAVAPFAITVKADNNDHIGTYLESGDFLYATVLYNRQTYYQWVRNASEDVVYYNVIVEGQTNSYRVLFVSPTETSIQTMGTTLGGGTTPTGGSWTTRNINRYNADIDGYYASEIVNLNFDWLANGQKIVTDTQWSDADILAYIANHQPEPEPDDGIGLLQDVSYSTEIIGYQGAGYANKDTISWNRFKTTTGHYLTPSNHFIEIRAISAEYKASSEAGLLGATIQDLNTAIVGQPTLYYGSPDPGYFTVSWGVVFNHLNKTFSNVQQITSDGQYWTREGWVYQIRVYCEPENVYSEWQDLYPLVSSSGDSMQGFNSDGTPTYNTNFNDYYDLVNCMNNTSMVNNNTNNIMTINNNEYLTNPDNHTTNETNNDITNNFIENFKDYHDREDDYIGNFEEVLQDIDPTSDMIDDANFLSAGNWVKNQYVRMVQGTPIEKLVQFSLTLGLGILIIGKAK